MSDAEDEIRTISIERQRAIEYSANLEIIRINRYRLWDEHKSKIGSLDTGTENLDGDIFEPGFYYVATNITVLETGTKPTTYAIGYVRAGLFHILDKSTPANNNDSASYLGQAILKEGDQIRVQAKGATAGDTLELFADGYKVRL